MKYQEIGNLLISIVRKSRSYVIDVVVDNGSFSKFEQNPLQSTPSS